MQSLRSQLPESQGPFEALLRCGHSKISCIIPSDHSEASATSDTTIESRLALAKLR